MLSWEHWVKETQDPPACLRQVVTGSGKPRARQCRARLPPRATLLLLGSTTHVGGTVVDPTDSQWGSAEKGVVAGRASYTRCLCHCIHEENIEVVMLWSSKTVFTEDRIQRAASYMEGWHSAMAKPLFSGYSVFNFLFPSVCLSAFSSTFFLHNPILRLLILDAPFLWSSVRHCQHAIPQRDYNDSLLFSQGHSQAYICTLTLRSCRPITWSFFRK